MTYIATIVMSCLTFYSLTLTHVLNSLQISDIQCIWYHFWRKWNTILHTFIYISKGCKNINEKRGYFRCFIRGLCCIYCHKTASHCAIFLLTQQYDSSLISKYIFWWNKKCACHVHWKDAITMLFIPIYRK